VIEEGLFSIHPRKPSARQVKLVFAWGEFPSKEIRLNRQNARVPSKIICAQHFRRFKVRVAVGINRWEVGEIDHGTASAKHVSASTSNNTNGTVPKGTICPNSNRG
jgi:hypothetical protein